MDFPTVSPDRQVVVRLGLRPFPSLVASLLGHPFRLDPSHRGHPSALVDRPFDQVDQEDVCMVAQVEVSCRAVVDHHKARPVACLHLLDLPSPVDRAVAHLDRLLVGSFEDLNHTDQDQRTGHPRVDLPYLLAHRVVAVHRPADHWDHSVASHQRLVACPQVDWVLSAPSVRKVPSLPTSCYGKSELKRYIHMFTT